MDCSTSTSASTPSYGTISVCFIFTSLFEKKSNKKEGCKRDTERFILNIMNERKNNNKKGIEIEFALQVHESIVNKFQ